MTEVCSKRKKSLHVHVSMVGLTNFVSLASGLDWARRMLGLALIK